LFSLYFLCMHDTTMPVFLHAAPSVAICYLIYMFICK
jgi:hypothetical protein